MFGSNFDANFGIPQQPQFPFQGVDPQGGLFGQNSPSLEGQQIGGGPATPAQAAASTAPPGTPQPPQEILHPLNSASPLGSPLSPPSAPSNQTPSPSAPAAGISSPFGGGKS